jgi:broad specificity phosphatase PhoE
MSTLTLVRHGQARAFEKESDRLSQLGEEQSRALAQFWLRQGTTFDEVYTGPLVRQQATANIAWTVMKDAGLGFPSPIVIPEFQEYDSGGILTRLVPSLSRADATFSKLVEAFETATTDRNRHFQRMFEIVVLQWVEGRVEADGVEPWPAFRDRVRRAISDLTTRGGGRRIAVFTSGGPIGVAVQTALAAPDRTAMEINWRVRNCSLTEFTFGGGRFSLDGFNNTPHLENPGLLTYR